MSYRDRMASNVGRSNASNAATPTPMSSPATRLNPRLSGGFLANSAIPLSGAIEMAGYRAFTVGTDGHFVGFEPIVCDTDDQAVARAKHLLDGRAIEVWCAERLVAKLKPENPQRRANVPK
jgi:hypothetical protein